MSASEIFFIVVRWLHLLAAVAWVGGSVFYLAVLRPALRRADGKPSPLTNAVATEFRHLVDICIWTLFITGAVIAANRLTSGFRGTSYIVTLAIKISLALAMFVVAYSLRRRALSSSAQTVNKPQGRVRASILSPSSILIMGVAVLLLSEVLRFIVEQELAGR